MAFGHSKCSHCERQDFRSQRGLTQHQSQSKMCKARALQHTGDDSGYCTAHQYLFIENVEKVTNKNLTIYEAFVAQTVAEDLAARKQIALRNMKTDTLKQSVNANTGDNVKLDDFCETAMKEHSLTHSDDMMVLDDSDASTDSELNVVFDESMRQMFNSFVSEQARNFGYFTSSQRNATKLLLVLRKTKASMTTCESVMHWHLTANNKLSPHQTLSDGTSCTSRKRMFSFLKQRYYITLNEGHKVRKITLPYSKATPNIVCHEAKTAIISLLTDSRIVDDDHLFFDNNSFQPLPDAIDCVKDLNTERAHTDSYRKCMTKPTS